MDKVAEEEAKEVARGEIVLKAAQCCLDLLTRLGTYDINVEDCATKLLRIHLGIGAGPIYEVHVGGPPGRWEFFISGDGVNQLGSVLDLAKAGMYLKVSKRLTFRRISHVASSIKTFLCHCGH